MERMSAAAVSASVSFASASAVASAVIWSPLSCAVLRIEPVRSPTRSSSRCAIAALASSVSSQSANWARYVVHGGALVPAPPLGRELGGPQPLDSVDSLTGHVAPSRVA